MKNKRKGKGQDRTVEERKQGARGKGIGEKQISRSTQQRKQRRDNTKREAKSVMSYIEK